MSTVLGLLTTYWQYALIGVGLLAAVGYVHERDRRIANEAVAEERLADFRESNARADSLDNVLAATDSQFHAAQARISQLRARADSVARVASSQAREASIRAASVGDSLTATLDSLHAVAPPELTPLVTAARQQHRRERSAHLSVARSLRDQVGSLERSLSLADSTSRSWRLRYTTLEGAYRARGEALTQAREALEASTAASGGGFVEKLAWGAAGVGVGALAVSLVR